MAESNDAPAGSALLEELSTTAARSYHSSAEAIDATVRLIGEHLGLRTGLVNRIDCAAGELEVLAAHNAPGGSDVVPGDTLALPDTI